MKVDGSSLYVVYVGARLCSVGASDARWTGAAQLRPVSRWGARAVRMLLDQLATLALSRLHPYAEAIIAQECRSDTYLARL